MSATAGDSAAASVHVALDIVDAFDVFTNEIDVWWRTGRKYRIAGTRPGRMRFESGVGGRLFETVDLASGPRTFVVGTVVAWEPPTHLALVWRNVNFKPHEQTLVEVTFTPLGEGTMVRVAHTGWSALPEEHPARHGKQGAEFARMIGMWWGDVLTGLREHVRAKGT